MSAQPQLPQGSSGPSTPAASPLKTVQDLLNQFKSQIAVALPRHMTPERMIRVALTAFTQTPLLQKCDPYTVCGAVVQASILGLEPNSALGEAFLIPYWNNKAGRDGRGGYECQLQVGYKGHLKLARNSGEIAMVDAQPVHENDDFDCEKGDTPYLRHKWAKTGTRGKVIGYWAGFKTKDGTFHFEYWSTEQIEAHRDRYSQGAFKRERGQLVKGPDGKPILQGPWKDSDWMHRKTVLIQALKLAPKSVNLQTAINLDENATAGIPQQFSLEVPLELHPAQYDPHAEEQGQIGMPQRASESQQQQPGALEQPPETDTSRLNLEGFPEPFSINAFKVACAKVYQRMVDSPMGQAAAQAEWQRAMKANNVKDPNGVASKEAAEKLYSMLVGIAQISESMRTSGED